MATNINTFCHVGGRDKHVLIGEKNMHDVIIAAHRNEDIAS